MNKYESWDRVKHVYCASFTTTCYSIATLPASQKWRDKSLFTCIIYNIHKTQSNLLTKHRPKQWLVFFIMSMRSYYGTKCRWILVYHLPPCNKNNLLLFWLLPLDKYALDITIHRKLNLISPANMKGQFCQCNNKGLNRKPFLICDCTHCLQNSNWKKTLWTF